jgi:uncharacterized protein
VNVPLREAGGEVVFAVKVVPGAARDRIVGALGDAVKVAVTQAPERGRANAAVCALLAAALGIAPRAVRIAAGTTAARKQVAVRGLTAPAVLARLQAAAAPTD